MYYALFDDKIIGFDNDKQRLIDTLSFTPHYEGYELKETKDEIIEFNGDYVFRKDIDTELDTEMKKQTAFLFLTAADVERAIYKSKGLDFDDILAMVKDDPNVDIKALRIELKANNFYRGNPYVAQIGKLLGFSEDQLDEFFRTNNYEVLKNAV